MESAIVVARSLNGIIGDGLKIPWKVKGEQLLFKQLTMGSSLVMGRKTYESIGRPLPGRTTIIVTRNREYEQPGCSICNSLEAALALADKSGEPVVFAGGGEIYRLALPLVDIVHISTIQIDVPGDIRFPTFPTPEFVLTDEKYYESNIDYIYQRFERKPGTDL